MKTKTQIVNIIGGPGVGKSTIASGVYHTLKVNKISCELVTEFAKEVTWEETQKLLENQIHIFSEQFRRQWRLIDKVDYIITDSPLILNSIYYDYYLNKLGDQVKFSKEYIDLSRKFFDATFQEFNNINFFCVRFTDFEQTGRNQTHDEAINIDDEILKKLFDIDPDYIVCAGDTGYVAQSISNLLIQNKKEENHE